MTKPKLNYHNSLPDATQTLLLKACLAEAPEESINAWNDWIAANNFSRPAFFKEKRLLPQVFDNLDFGSQRILSLLYKRMLSAKISDPLINELKGYYRYVWVRNQVLRNQLEELVTLFHSSGIKHVIIKGFPKVEKFYKDWGARSVLDLDVVIHREDWAKTLAILKENKWESKHSSLNAEQIVHTLHHGHALEKNSNELDLHIRFTRFPLNAEIEKRFWTEAQFYKDNHRMLKPEHQLICTFAHGIYRKEEAMRTIADVVYIVRHTKINWSEVVDIARSCNLLIPTRAFIEYLNNEKFVEIRGEAIDQLMTLSPSPFERRYFKVVLAATSSNGFKDLKLNVLHSSAMVSSRKKRIRLLLNTYRFQWGIGSVAGLFFASLWVAFHKIFVPNGNKEKIELRRIPFLSKSRS